MIKILIVDDNSYKVKCLREILNEYATVCKYDIAVDVVDARRYLIAGYYDLMILDLNLPNRTGDDAKAETGIGFLTEINQSIKLTKPFHIIGFTAFDENLDQFKNQFETDLWKLIKYSESSTNWIKQLKGKIEYLVQSKSNLAGLQLGYNYDIAIITALRSPELDSVLRLPADWESFYINNDSTEYHRGLFVQGDKKLKIIAATAPQMGMVPTTVLSMKIIQNFRPKYIVMVGIAGGYKGVGGLGDILFTCHSFDSGSGKINSDSEGNAKFEPDYKSIPVSTDIKELAISCKGSRDFLDLIKRSWQGESPSKELDVHLGPLASGAGVISNSRVIDEIKGFNRKLIGLDMETYGVFYASENCSKPRPIALSIKSVTDFADAEKSDTYQKYASFTSANYLYHFALNRMPFN